VDGDLFVDADHLAFDVAVAYANSLPDDVHVTIEVGGGVYNGPGACNAPLTHPFVAIVGNGSETTVFDCGWASRWLAFTGTSLALSGVTIINASSFSNGLEAGGVVSGGAVLVDWGGGGTSLSFTMRDVVVQGARAEFNGSAGHVGDHVIGGAIGVLIGPEGPAESVTIAVEECVFLDVLVAAGALCNAHSFFVLPSELCLAGAFPAVRQHETLRPVPTRTLCSE
jgi:hypothetical protein